MDIDSFCKRVDRLAHISGLATSTLSSKILNDGKRLAEIRSGKDIGVRRLARAEAELEALEAQYGVVIDVMSPSSQAAGSGDTQKHAENVESRTSEPQAGRAG